MKIKSRKFSVPNIVSYLLIGILVLDCFSLYYKIVGYKIFQIACIGIVLCLILFDLVQGKRISKSAIYFITYYIIVYTILLFISDYAYLGFITGCMIPIILFTVSLSMNNNINYSVTILSIFSDIICVISCISLFFYLTGSIYKIIEPTTLYSSSKIGWADYNYRSYLDIYFEGQNTFFFGQTILRNIGIFLEAPVFAYVIITALYIEMFMRRQIRKKRIIILIAAVLSTYSTVGIALCVILIVLFVFKKTRNKNVLILLAPIFIIIALYIVISVVGDKVAVGNDSGTARIDDFVACFKCFFDNPIGGVGHNQVRAIDPYRAASRQNGTAGMSAGIPFVLANGGIVYGSIYILPLVIALYRLSKKTLNIEQIGFIILQFILLTEIVVEYTLLGQFFLVMSWLWALDYNNRVDVQYI